MFAALVIGTVFASLFLTIFYSASRLATAAERASSESAENASWKARDGTKLPNGERAIVDSRKLQAYCLNPQHPRGRNKARVFASAGIRQTDADELRTALLAAAASAEAQTGIANPYGQRYIIDFELVRENKIVKIRSTWIVRIGEDMPRLTSCYVL